MSITVVVDHDPHEFGRWRWELWQCSPAVTCIRYGGGFADYHAALEAGNVARAQLAAEPDSEGGEPD